MQFLENKVKKAARKGAAFSVGTVIFLVGVGFLTVAAWILLSTWHDALFAATVIGLGYCGLGAIAMGFALRSGKATRLETVKVEQQLSPLQLVLLSFLDGFEQGRRTK